MKKASILQRISTNKMSTRTHGVIDYTTAAGLFALPRLLRWNPGVTKFMTAAAVTTAVYSLFTKYELGVFKLLPFKVHRGLDAAQSAAMATAPVLFARNSQVETLGLIGLSLFEALVTLRTEKRPRRRFLGFRF